MIAKAFTDKIWTEDAEKGPKLEDSFAFCLTARQKYCARLRDKRYVRESVLAQEAEIMCFADARIHGLDPTCTHSHT